MKNGPYEMLIAPKGYPGKKYRGRYAYEHNLVWWQKHGSVPQNGYEIHHINGNHRDNRLKNLRLLTSEAHRLLHGKKKSASAIVFTECFKCNKLFEVLASRMKSRRAKNKGRRIFCSRKCQISVQMKERWDQFR